MTGWRATLDDSIVCGFERALLNTSFAYLFIFIEGNAVKVINLNYIALVCEILHGKLSKIVLESAATSNSTYTTKLIQK